MCGNQSFHMFLTINTSKKTSLTSSQILQLSNYMPEKQQHRYEKEKHEQIYFSTHKGPTDGEGVIRKLYLKKCGRRDSKLVPGSTGTN